MPITMAIPGLIHAFCDWFDNAHCNAFTLMLTLLLGEVRLSETTSVQSVHTHCHITLFSFTMQMELEGVRSMLNSKIYRPLLLPLPCDRPSVVFWGFSSPGQTALIPSTILHGVAFQGSLYPAYFPLALYPLLHVPLKTGLRIECCSPAVVWLPSYDFSHSTLSICFFFIPNLKWH